VTYITAFVPALCGCDAQRRTSRRTETALLQRGSRPPSPTFLSLRREDVFINLAEVTMENGSFGNGEAQYVIAPQ
jgi:hypothetical protein